VSKSEVHLLTSPTVDIDVQPFMIDFVTGGGGLIVIHPGDGVPLDGCRRGLVVQLDEETRDIPRLAVEADREGAVCSGGSDVFRDVES
jgi:hypothetical protein